MFRSSTAHIDSYYAATSREQQTPRPDLTESKRVDVCVVGAGAVGGYVGAHAAQAGVDTVLVENLDARVADLVVEHARAWGADLIAAIEANNHNDGAGRLTAGEEALIVRSTGAIRTLEDLAAVVVRADGRAVVRVGDVATWGQDRMWIIEDALAK